MRPGCSRDCAIAALAWLSIVILGAGLRLWQLPDQLLLDDEWHAIHALLRSGFSDILTHFGRSDYSIPLTAYYNAITRWGGGLTEWGMRLPLLVAGIAMIVAIPYLMRDILACRERLVAGALLAVAPLMIYYSRQARPYTLAVLLACIAVYGFWRWWRLGDRRWGAVYVVATALAAWLLPVTLAFTLAPGIWAGVIALLGMLRRRDARPFLSLFRLGMVLFASLALLLGPPLYNDYDSLFGKAGTDNLTLQSAQVALELFAGATAWPVVLAWCGLALFGGYRLACREPAFTAYLGCVGVIGLVVIIFTDAAYISHGLVFARHLLTLLPFVLVLVAIGAAALLRPLPVWAQAGAIAVGLLVLYFVGPIPAQYHQPINQLTGHAAYHFDYDFQRSAYRTMLPRGPVAPFYRQLREQPPRSVTLIMAPWYMESHWNRLHYEQEAHQQRLLAGLAKGYCGESEWGEHPADAPGMDLRRMVHLSEVATAPDEQDADYLVLRFPASEPPHEALDEWLGHRARLRPSPHDACLERLLEDLGPPVYEDRAMAVFSLGDDPANASGLAP